MALLPRDQRHEYLRFDGLQYTDTDIADFKERLGRIYNREAESVRQIPDKGHLSAYWREISFVGDFLSTAPSYTSIRDPMLRLCHRMITCSIAGRRHTLEKVTVTDLFYLRGMDVGSVNIPYLLARYLRLFPSGRKRRAMISGGLTVIMRDLLVIDMGELVRLQICEELDDTWAWVAPGPERQPDVAASAPEIVEGTSHVDEGSQAILAPTKEPQPPPAARPTQTMA
ncbi:hypothetical protein Tco_0613924 [Tanacetum coccineum]